MKRLLSLCVIFICAYASVYAQCTVPTSVTIAGPAAISICEGTALTLSGSVLVPGAPQNTSFTYSWKKTTVDLVTPTDIVVAANTATTIPGYTNITGTLADAGMYVLRVEDGNAGNASCYTEASVVVTVNPKPVITSAVTEDACSGVAQNYLITSSVPSTYIWARSTVTGITSPARRDTIRLITEILTNTTAGDRIVRYNITPTSFNGCVGASFNYDVTVHPKPSITSVTTGAICSGTAQNYQITSDMSSTYYWTRAVVVNIGPNTPGSGTSTPITETLTNTTATATVVRYTITPTSITGGCVGFPFIYDVTVANEIPPAVSITTNTGSTICAGTSVTFNATPSNGGTTPTYAWQSSINGLLASTTDTYTSNNLVDGEVITATMTSNLACAMPKVASSNIVMSVLSELIPAVSITSNQAIICEGSPVVFYASPTNVLSHPLYEWFIESGGIQTSQGTASSFGAFTTSALKPNNTVLVKMTSTDACASSIPIFSDPLKIKVGPGSFSGGTIGIDQTICYGAIPAMIKDITSSDAPMPVYSWYYRTQNNPNWYKISSERNSSYLPTNGYSSDVYFRRTVMDSSIAANCLVAVSNEVHITVLLSCVFSFSSSITGNSQITPGQQNVSYSVQNQAGISYAWSIIGGTIISGQGTNAIIVNWDGSPIGIAMARTTVPSYAVSVTETNQANESKTTTMELNTITTASTISLAQSGIQFYPNPSTDAFNILMPQSGTLVQYNITDLSGMSVASGTFTSSGGAEKIPTNFNTGLYQVVLTYNETVTCLRLNKVQ